MLKVSTPAAIHRTLAVNDERHDRKDTAPKVTGCSAAQLWRQPPRLSCKAVARYESRASSTPPWTKAVVVSAEVSSFPQRRHSSAKSSGYSEASR